MLVSTVSVSSNIGQTYQRREVKYSSRKTMEGC